MSSTEQLRHYGIQALRREEGKTNRWSLVKKAQLALLAIGVVLGGTYIAAKLDSWFASRAALEMVAREEPIVADRQPLQERWEHVVEPDSSRWRAARIRSYLQASYGADGTPLAILLIPKIQLQAPVFDGTDAMTQNRGVGRIAGTARPGESGNVGLAAHREGFFRGLKDIRLGDEILLRALNDISIYTVARIQIVDPSDVSVLRVTDKPALTLVTCYPFHFVGNAPKRYVVTAFFSRHSEYDSQAVNHRVALKHHPVQEEP